MGICCPMQWEHCGSMADVFGGECYTMRWWHWGICPWGETLCGKMLWWEQLCHATTMSLAETLHHVTAILQGEMSMAYVAGGYVLTCHSNILGEKLWGETLHCTMVTLCGETLKADIVGGDVSFQDSNGTGGDVKEQKLQGGMLWNKPAGGKVGGRHPRGKRWMEMAAGGESSATLNRGKRDVVVLHIFF